MTTATSPLYVEEVVVSEGICCANTLGTDHFCGNGKRIRDTISRCNICKVECRAEVFQSNDIPARIYMVKHCPEHGRTSSRISSDAQFYHIKQGSEAACCGPLGCSTSPLGENATEGKQLHACTLVVEIVYDCNLKCPTCYAGSPHASAGKTESFLSFDDFKNQITEVLTTQGKIDIVQLSGGEPTLHPELMHIIAWLGGQEGVADTLLNTNGIKLCDPVFIREIAKCAPKGKFAVYLQYDGSEKLGQQELRAGDFRHIRERAIGHCHQHKIPVALVMTVTHDNKFDCASAVNKALSDENIRWVVFQPEFISGRNDQSKRLENKINVADIVHGVALGGLMDKSSWIPLPCSDPNCGTVGFMVRKDGVWQPVSLFIDTAQFAPFIANRMNFDIDDTLASCGCEGVSLEEELAKLGIEKKDVKMFFIKPFMDVRDWDTARIAACCTHVLTPQGKLDSFCHYYGTK